VALIDVNSMGVGDVPSEIGNIPNQRVFFKIIFTITIGSNIT
jgi:hypothetical protein